MKLVVDASFAVAGVATPLGLERLRSYTLVVPPPLRIEALSVARHAVARRWPTTARSRCDRLLAAPISIT